jgi:hypothetical protein
MLVMCSDRIRRIFDWLLERNRKFAEVPHNRPRGQGHKARKNWAYSHSIRNGTLGNPVYVQAVVSRYHRVGNHVNQPAPKIPSKPLVFRGEIAPCEHIAQFYEHDGVLLDSLERFVHAGVVGNESAIVIATRQHLRSLEDRLNATGVNVAMLRLLDQYVTVDADEALDQFMVNKWPDDDLFFKFVTGMIERASADGRRVRAFGEMVALLWARGDTEATIRLEYLWNKVCKTPEFSLFCAYPKAGIAEDTSTSMADICAAHSRII